MNNLSVIIITKNEEKNIERCLDSIKNLANEIILVDSGSTDQTLNIAKEYTDKIFFRQWDDDFSAQKNYALSKTSNDWILSIDADEEISKELAEEINNFLNSKEKYSGIYLPRKNIIFGKWLKYGDSGPDYQLKLFKKGSYFKRPVHEMVIIDGASDFFKHPIIHHHYKNIKEFIERTKKYTNLEVTILSKDKKNGSFLAILIYPPAKFLKVYFYKKGFLDGWHGFIYAVLLAYYSFLKRFKFFKYRFKS